MSKVKPVGFESSPALQAVPLESTLGDKLKTGAVIVASVGVGSAMAYPFVSEKSGWAKFSTPKKISTGAFALGAGLIGAGGSLMVGGALIKSNTIWRAGVVAGGGVLLAYGSGMVLSVPQKTKNANEETVVIATGVICAMAGLFLVGQGFSPSNRVALSLSHVAVSDNGIMATGQF